MLPILTFHRLDAEPSVLAYDPMRFSELLLHLARAGYRTLDLLDAVNRIRRGERIPSHSLVITFDDGDQSVYTYALPVLQRHAMTATVFLITGTRVSPASDVRLPVGNGRAGLSWGEIRELQRYGMAFGAHTLTHADLTRLDAVSLEREVRDSQATIANALGIAVPCFAYPRGRYDARTRAMVAKYFACACSDQLGLVTMTSDPLALERVEMYYLRARWGRRVLTSYWLPWYLAARNIPRALRRRFAY